MHNRYPHLVSRSPRPDRERRRRPRTEDAATEAAIRYYMELAASALGEERESNLTGLFWPQKPKAS